MGGLPPLDGGSLTYEQTTPFLPQTQIWKSENSGNPDFPQNFLKVKFSDSEFLRPQVPEPFFIQNFLNQDSQILRTWGLHLFNTLEGCSDRV